MELKITKSKAKDKKLIYDKIVKYNAECVPFTQKKAFIHLDYIIKDNATNIITGINSILYCWHCLYIDVLWVSKDHRKSGLGSILIQKVEEEAKKKGCYLMHLSTFDWQAKDFYLKHGFEVCGEIKDNPKGHSQYFMKKSI